MTSLAASSHLSQSDVTGLSAAWPLSHCTHALAELGRRRRRLHERGVSRGKCTGFLESDRRVAALCATCPRADDTATMTRMPLPARLELPV